MTRMQSRKVPPDKVNRPDVPKRASDRDTAVCKRLALAMATGKAIP